MFSESKWFNPGGAAFDTTLIGNSAWLDGSADTLAKTFSSGSAQTKVVISTWVQRNSFGTIQDIFSATGGTGGASRSNRIHFQTDDTIDIQIETTSLLTIIYSTTRVFRDVGFYHILLSIDQGETQGPAQVNLYINGVAETIAATVLDQGFSAALSSWGNAALHNVGSNGGTGTFLNGSVAQTTMLVGQSIQASDVAVTDFLDSFTFGTNGSQYAPKSDADIAALATTAGGNSFCLDFAASSDLGNDISSNNNDFTPTSMAAANQTTNTPSLVYPRVNVLRPSISGKSFSEGALKVSSTSGFGNGNVLTTFPLSTGGYWYWEIIDAAAAANQTYGIAKADAGANASGLGGDTKAWGFYNNQYRHNGNIGAVPDSPTNTGTRYMFAVDVDAGKFWMGNDGTWWKPVGGSTAGDPAAGTNPAFTDADIAEGDTFPAMDLWSSDSATFVFEDTDFAHTVPTGYLSLNTANLSAPDAQGVDLFSSTLFTGDGTAIGSGGLTVSNGNFSPALVWIKNRDATDDHAWYDTQRGVTKQIESNTQTIESTEAEGLTAFTSTGFTVGNLAQVNTNTEKYVAWQWKAGTAFSGDGSGGAAGTVASSGVVADAGHFSIFKFVANSGSAYTAKHGLSVAPEFFVVKHSGTSGSAWVAYAQHTASDAETDYIIFDGDGAMVDDASVWNDTAPTSAVVSIGTNSTINNGTAAMIGYAWRSVPGVCRVGSYTGNSNDDGPHLSLGFRPAWFIVKCSSFSDASHDWFVADSTRYTFNGTTTTSSGTLEANENTAEQAHSTNFGDNPAFDFLADGIKIRSNSGTINATGRTYIYIAMADIASGAGLCPIFGR